MTGKNKVVVNFVCKNYYIVFFADFCKASKFAYCPNTSDWIVRTAQNEKAHVVLFYFVFKVFKIYLIFSVFFD